MTDWGPLHLAAASLPLLGGLLVGVCGPGRSRLAAWVSLVALAFAVVLSFAGLVLYQQHTQASKAQLQPVQPWTGSVPWLRLSQLGLEGRGRLGYPPDSPGVELRLGYHVDALTTVLFTVISTVTFLIVAAARSVKHTRWLALACLLCGLMLHLILADNLLQLFLCWVLIGIATAGLASASMRVFVIQRAGDVALLIGIIVLADSTGTLSLVTVREVERNVAGQVVYEDDKPKMRIAQLSIFDALRTPARDTHDEPFAEPGAEGGKICRVTPTRTARGKKKLELAERGPLLVIWNQETLNGHYDRPDRKRFDAFDPDAGGGHGKGLRTMPYWALGLAGFAILLACFSKSAQFPLNTWLQDATAGSPPCGALIGGVSLLGGVYLAARLFPLLTPEVLLTMAYLGAISAALLAERAFHQSDPRQVITCLSMSQFGLAFAALGVGGWTAALIHSCVLATLVCGCFLSLRPESTPQRRTLLTLCLALALTYLLLLPAWPSSSAPGGILAPLWSFVSLHTRHALVTILSLLAVTIATVTILRILWTERILKLTPLQVQESSRGRGMAWPFVALFALPVVWGSLASFAQQAEPATAEPGLLRLQDASDQVVSGYFKSDSWLRPLHEATHLGPRGLALVSLFVIFALATVFVLILRRRPAAAAAQGAFHLARTDTFCTHAVITPVRYLATTLDDVDRRVWPAVATGLTRLAMTVANLASAFDDHVLGRITSAVAWLGLLLLRPFRRGNS